MIQVNPTNLRHYLEYNKERARVHYNKEILALPQPWTDNSILQQYRFTNVKRWLDKETVNLLDNVINNESVSLDDKYLWCALFRIINKWESVEQTLLESSDDVYSIKKLSEKDFISINNREMSRKDSGLNSPMQSSAYFLSHTRAAANRVVTDELKYSNTAQLYFIWTHMDVILKASKSELASDTINILQTIPSIGDFLSYQIWVDWTYIKGFHQSENDLVISGPGCSEGLKFLFDKSDGYTDEQLLWYIKDNIHSLCDMYCDEPWDPITWLPISGNSGYTIMDFENSFCEFAKYMKLVLGIKMRRRIYTR